MAKQLAMKTRTTPTRHRTNRPHFTAKVEGSVGSGGSGDSTHISEQEETDAVGLALDGRLGDMLATIRRRRSGEGLAFRQRGSRWCLAPASNDTDPEPELEGRANNKDNHTARSHADGVERESRQQQCGRDKVVLHIGPPRDVRPCLARVSMPQLRPTNLQQLALIDTRPS